MDKKAIHGYTLIELLMVVAIVTILSALFYPSVLEYRKRAETAKAISLMQAVVTPLLEYRAQNGRFPPDVNQNVKPLGLPDGYWLNAAQLPLGLIPDYNHHCNGNGDLVVTIFLLGQDGIYNTSIYAQQSRDALGDDIIIPVRVEDCQGAARSIR